MVWFVLSMGHCLGYNKTPSKYICGTTTKYYDFYQISTTKNSNLHPSDSCGMLQPFKLSGSEMSYLMFWNTVSAGIDIFVCNVNIEMQMCTVH